MRSLTISSRLVLLILVAATPVLVLHVWGALDARSEVLEVAEDQIQRSSRLLAAQQVQLFLNARNVLDTLLVVAEELGVEDFNCDTLLDRIAAENQSYIAVGIADVSGTLRCSSDASQVNEYVRDTDFFTSVSATTSLYIGTPSNGSLPLGLASRATSGDLRFIGIALLDLDRLTSDMALSRLPAEGIGMIFNADREVLAKVPASADVVEGVFDALGPQVAQSSGGPGMVETMDIEGARQLWAVSDFLPEQGLFVAIGVRIDDLVASAESSLWRGIGILIAVFAGAAATAWIIGERTIRRPLERLASSASALQAGDLSVRYDADSSTREFRQLQLGFNQMASSIEGHQKEAENRAEKLNQLIAEKEMLVREMNHRIKNSLQLVSSVVGLQLGTVADEEAQRRLRDAQARIAAIAKVHERLYVGVRLDMVEVGPFIEELCADLKRTHALADQELFVDVDKSDLPPDRVIPLGMIVSELVTNAIKYAGSEGKIEVRLEKIADKLRLSVTDSGQGIPQNLNGQKSTGLGLKVVRALAKQLGSELEVDRLESGTRFRIDVPSDLGDAAGNSG